MRSKLFHAIVVAGATLGAGACNQASPLTTGADASLDASALDLADAGDASSALDAASGDLAGCFMCPWGPICPSPCPVDSGACWPCFI
jgi:hypothetical protein